MVTAKQPAGRPAPPRASPSPGALLAGARNARGGRRMRPTIRIKARRLRLWRGAAVLAAAALGCAGLTAVAAAPASAAPVCQVTYAVNSDWGTGFSVAGNITNNGAAITSWTLVYVYHGN